MIFETCYYTVAPPVVRSSIDDTGNNSFCPAVTTPYSYFCHVKRWEDFDKTDYIVRFSADTTHY